MKTLISIFFILIIPISLLSQDFEKYMKEKQKEYDEYFKQTEEEYKKFIEERDKEFSKHLKENWETFQMKHGKTPVDKPKPDIFPAYIDSLQREFNIIEYNKPVFDSLSYKPVIRTVRTIESFTFYKKIVSNFDFYGEPIRLEYEDISSIKLSNTFFSNQTIGNYWDKLNQIDFDNCVSQLIFYKDKLNLNDWGYYLFVKEFVQQINDDNEFYKILMWYLLLKSEYNVKVGYADTYMLLLIPFDTDIYGIPYYEISGEIYYVFEYENPGTIKTYMQYYPGAEKIVKPAIQNPPNFSSVLEQKHIQYNYNGQFYQLIVDINEKLSGFYNCFPLMELDNYFNASMSVYTKKSLHKSFDNLLENKTQEKAVSFLLYFSQNAFKYKTDKEHFGREKIYFPDEMFFYNYSDCEDRAIFFAYMVKEFIGLKVIGLDYEDHVAVAINFKEEVEGNYIIWKGEKYVVCDPTYINAPIGKIPPKHLNKKVTLINIEY